MPDVPVRLDPRLTATALAHLLENAAQYSPAGSTISVNASVTGDGLVIQVRDHGPGIATADLPHLFDRFYRGAAAKTRASRAPAWGCAIARGLLAVERGRIWAENGPDGGAQFTIVVPATTERSPSPRPRQPHDTRTPAFCSSTTRWRSSAPWGRCCGRAAMTSTSPAPGPRRSSCSPSGRRISIVLDLGLPDLEGTEVCRRVRATSKVPIVVLSARGAEADKVNALDLGADDYVTKPFGPEELLARIRVALRRVTSEDEAETGVFRAGDLTIDYDRRRVLRDETEIRLTPKEFELLSLLARNHDRVLTHRAILKAIWGPNAVEQPEHLWTLVAQLRKKIEPDPANPQYLLSEPWVGYRFATGDPARQLAAPVSSPSARLQDFLRNFLALLRRVPLVWRAGSSSSRQRGVPCSISCSSASRFCSLS